MYHKTIDVLFPFYGDVELMKLAVESVLSQTYGNWRLLVFDNAVPGEETQLFFAKLIENEIAERSSSRINYTRNPKNIGANANYRLALGAASNEFFIMMGADDLMHPEYLERFAHVVTDNPSIDVYQPMVKVIDENGTEYLPIADRVKRIIMPRKGGLMSGEQFAKSYVHGWLYYPATIWRTVCAQAVGFNENFDTALDLYMGLDIIQNGGNFYLDREATNFSYRRHSASFSSQKAISKEFINQEHDFFRSKEREFRALGWHKAARSARWHLPARLSAVSKIPKAIRLRDGALRTLTNYIFAPN